MFLMAAAADDTLSALVREAAGRMATRPPPSPAEMEAAMKEAGYFLAGLMLPAVIYAGSYLAMIVPDTVVLDDVARQLGRPAYRFGGESVDAFFRPAFEVDRRLRPERWRPIMPPPCLLPPWP